MIELFASDTPNGKKISIMLEEINLPFNVIPVDLNKGEQFEKIFVEISPFNVLLITRDSGFAFAMSIFSEVISINA